MSPKRINYVPRQKGKRLPPGARLVTRGSRWGNPYALLPDKSNRHAVVAQFRAYAEDRMRQEPEWLAPLRGLDLACTCTLDEECHADVLLKLANAAPPPSD